MNTNNLTALSSEEMLSLIKQQEKNIQNQQKEILKLKKIALKDIHKDNLHTENHTALATVFSRLFGDVHYTLQLYNALHPEDKTVVEDDIMLMTIESYLINQQYNDLGFLVNDRLIILAEHQSTWSENIVIRSLMYIVETWLKYVKMLKMNIYRRKKLILPKPELYMIYTGEKVDNMPEKLTLRKDFFNDPDVCIDCEVKIIYGGNKGDIIDQFFVFSDVLKEQNEIYGKTEKAVLEAIRICIERNALKEFLEQQGKEVVNIMLALYDYETMMESHDNDVRSEGIEIGEKKGQQETMAIAIKNLMKSLPCTADKAMDLLAVPQDQRIMYAGLVQNN